MNSDFLNDFDWAGMAQKAVFALVILLVTWLIAKLVAKAFGKLVERIPALQRNGTDGKSLGESLGKIASLIVWLFGLTAILQLFGMDQVLLPVQELLNSVMAFVPNFIAAAFVFVIGLILANVVKQIIETALSAAGFDSWLSRLGGKAKHAGTSGTRSAGTEAHGEYAAHTTDTTDTTGTSQVSISSIIARVVHALILIVVTIAALDLLGIAAISEPASQMLSTILNAVPNILAGALLLGIGVLIASFVGDLLAQTLGGLGIDRALHQAEVLPEGRSAVPTISTVVRVAIVLFFAVAATKMLGFPEITRFLTEVLSLGGRVLFGGAIIAAGFFVANLLAKLFGSGTATTVVKYATLALFAAMGLKYMGIADSIVELAFGAVVVGGALAAALAFGLGGREAAAKKLEEIRTQQ